MCFMSVENEQKWYLAPFWAKNDCFMCSSLERASFGQERGKYVKSWGIPPLVLGCGMDNKYELSTSQCCCRVIDGLRARLQFGADWHADGDSEPRPSPKRTLMSTFSTSGKSTSIVLTVSRAVNLNVIGQSAPRRTLKKKIGKNLVRMITSDSVVLSQHLQRIVWQTGNLRRLCERLSFPWENFLSNASLPPAPSFKVRLSVAKWQGRNETGESEQSRETKWYLAHSHCLCVYVRACVCVHALYSCRHLFFWASFSLFPSTVTFIAHAYIIYFELKTRGTHCKKGEKSFSHLASLSMFNNRAQSGSSASDTW